VAEATGGRESRLRRAAEALPAGTWPVAAGVLTNGLASYVFLAIPARTGRLDTDAYALFSAIWFVVFIFGPGLFVPLEQAVTRGIAARRSRSQGAMALERRATWALIVAAVGLLVVGALLSVPLASALFDDRRIAVIVVAGSVASFGLFQLAKGVAAGHRVMRAYGEILATEGIVRVVLAVALVTVGVGDPLAYAAILIVSPLVAVGFVRTRHVRDTEAGPVVERVELGTSLPSLLVAQLGAQALANSVPLALVAMAATDSARELAGQLSAGFVLSRVPLFLFQAVQAALLPRLTAEIVEGRSDTALGTLRRLEALLVALMVVAIAGLTVLGPWATTLLFGPDFAITWADMLWFSGGGALFVVAFLHHQALVAAGRVHITAMAWTCGLGINLAVLVVASSAGWGSDVGRVEVAYVVGILVVVIIARFFSHRELRADPVNQ